MILARNTINYLTPLRYNNTRKETIFYIYLIVAGPKQPQLVKNEYLSG